MPPPPPLLRSVSLQSVLFSPARPVHTPARNAGDQTARTRLVPVSTGGGTRRVQSVRERGRGGGAPSCRRPRGAALRVSPPPPPAHARSPSRPPPPLPRTNRTRRVPHPVLIGHAASLTQDRGRGVCGRVRGARPAAGRARAAGGDGAAPLLSGTASPSRLRMPLRAPLGKGRGVST